MKSEGEEAERPVETNKTGPFGASPEGTEELEKFRARERCGQVD